MALTAKQEAFAQAVASGKNQSDAYRMSYIAGKMTDKSVWERASKLASDAKVAPRIKNLKETLAKKQLWTREMSVKALVEAYRVAKDQAQASGMTGAVKELNCMHGFNAPDKLDVTVSNAQHLTDEELAKIVMMEK